MYIIDDDMVDHTSGELPSLLPGHRWRMRKVEVEKYAYRTKREALQGLATIVREEIEKEAQGDER